MARYEVNRFGEMDVFVRVVEQGSFSRAANAFGMSPSAVSKLIGRLEARLGTQLFNRSTRQLQLTAEGRSFHDRATRILSDLADAERAAGAGEQAVGRVQINTSSTYANHILAPILPAFLDRYPGLALDIIHTDAVADLLAERTDVAIRAGPLKTSSLVARKLGETELTIVAAPSYLARRGGPKILADLDQHERLGLGNGRAADHWSIDDRDRRAAKAVVGRIEASDGEALRHLALAGVGLARLAAFTVGDDIAAGRLVPVLVDDMIPAREQFHVIYVGQRSFLPLRVRALLDFLTEHGRVS